MESISCTEYQSDALICAGDVSDDCAVLEATLRLLMARFGGGVFFTPGNHDLWTQRRTSTPAADSLAKLRLVLALCARLGVQTQPRLVGGASGAAVWVVPLLSWHHAAFDDEQELTAIDVPPVHRVMTDFAACRWPVGVDDRGDGVVRLLDEQNGALPAELLLPRAQRRHAVVSFSHFLPHPALCPEKRFLFYPNLPKAVGSTFLRARVEALQPDAHAFGHLHFGWDTVLNGVRYLQASLAYPKERETRMGTLRVGNAFEGSTPLLVYDCAGAGCFAPKHRARWSEYYETNARQPASQELPEWVSRRYKARMRPAEVLR